MKELRLKEKKICIKYIKGLFQINLINFINLLLRSKEILKHLPNGKVPGEDGKENKLLKY